LLPVVDVEARRERAAGGQVVDLLASRQPVGAFGDPWIVAEYHHVAGAARQLFQDVDDLLRVREIKPFVLAHRVGGHLQFAGHDRRGGYGAHRGTRQDEVRLQLQRAQAPRHFRRIPLAALVQHAVPILLVG
jgi:hypothetical protein